MQAVALSTYIFTALTREFFKFQEKNNRLSYSDSEGEQGEASVDDKSFSLVEDNAVSEEEPLPVEMPPATQSKGFVKSVINFFGR